MAAPGYLEPAVRCHSGAVRMTADQSPDSIREAVGVFDDARSLEAVIDELLSSGFDRAEISLVAGEHAIEARLGHMYRKVEEAEDDPQVPRTAYVSTESIGDAEGALVGGLVYIGAVVTAGAVVASGGTLAGAVVAATLAGGAGGLIGSILAGIVGHHHADYLQEQLNRGGILLWVRTWDPEREMKALEILSKHSAHDVHVHDLPASTSALETSGA